MATEASVALKFRVQGMDCGACALKIEYGLKRLPGVSDINVNVRLREPKPKTEAYQRKISPISSETTLRS